MCLVVEFDSDSVTEPNPLLQKVRKININNKLEAKCLQEIFRHYDELISGMYMPEPKVYDFFTIKLPNVF